MKNQITSRDYEQISAYLDNQLSGKERVQFEARLKSDPALRKEMHEISKTRVMIRTLPRLRAPRNYYVNPSAVRVRPMNRLAPAMGIVSAVASILLVILIFSNPMVPTTPQVANAPVMESPSASEIVAQESQRSSESQPLPTESAPMAVMKAPELSPTVSGFGFGAGNTGLSELPTPTTIYVYAYPPTSTSVGQLPNMEEPTQLYDFSCIPYDGNGIPPTAQLGVICPTPTSTEFLFLFGVSSSGTPTETLTSTPTGSLSPIPTGTPSSTAIPTDTETPTPSETSTPSPSPTPLPTVTPSSLNDTNLSGQPGEAMQTGPAGEENNNPASVGSAPAETSASEPNVSFMSYVLLAAEISLAVIAILAGLIAIILRIRAG